MNNPNGRKPPGYRGKHRKPDGAAVAVAYPTLPEGGYPDSTETAATAGGPAGGNSQKQH